MDWLIQHFSENLTKLWGWRGVVLLLACAVGGYLFDRWEQRRKWPT